MWGGGGRGEVGTPQAVPLSSPRGPGQWGPTYLHSEDRVEACWGSLGTLEERQGGRLPWVPAPALWFFVLLEAKKFDRWECDRIIFQKPQIPGLSPAGRLALHPRGGAGFKGIRAGVSSHPAPRVPTGQVLMPRWSLRHPNCAHAPTGVTGPPHLGSPADSGCSGERRAPPAVWPPACCWP